MQIWGQDYQVPSMHFYWIAYMKMSRKPVVLDDFGQKECDLAMDIARIHNYEQETRGQNDKPEKFEMNQSIKQEQNMID